MINNTSPITFQGLRIYGTVSANNMKKLAEFTNATENMGFIKDLEKDLSTHVVLSGDLDQISFSHQIYGDLSRFNCKTFLAKDFYSNVVVAIDSIKAAIKKAEKTFNNSKDDINPIHRGC